MCAAQTTANPIFVDYPARFRWQVMNTLELSLQDVCAAGTRLSEEVKEQAIYILEFALTMAEAWPAVRKLLLQLSPDLERHGDRRRWLQLLGLGLRLAEQIHDQATAAQFHWSLGLLSRQISDFAAAEAHLRQCQQLAVTTGLVALSARALTERAHLLQMHHRLAEAKALIAQALQLLPVDDPDHAAAYSVLGDIYYAEAQWSQARIAIERAIALWEGSGQLTDAAGGWRGLARVRWATGDWEAAVACYARALALYQDTDNPLQRAVTALGFGALYLERGEPLQALPHFVTAEAILRPVEDHFHLAMLDLNYGIAYRLTSAWELALQALQRSLVYYQSTADHVRSVNGLIEVALVYLAMQATELARTALLQAQAILTQLPLAPEFTSLPLALAAAWQQLDQQMDRGAT